MMAIQLNKAYQGMFHDKNRYIIIYGGAGSGKSHFVAQQKVLQHLRDSNRKTLVIRKIGRTLRNSVFANIKESISDFGVENKFHIPKGKTDFDIKDSNGGEFIFTGLDDAEKLKSIVGITDVWIEECTEITEEDFKQVDLRLRGESPIPKQITMTFNPVSALSWIKGYFFDIKRDNCTILKTTYLDNKFIDEDYRKMLESLKDQDYVYYQIYALGEWGVLGNLIFTNYVIEEIPTRDAAYKSIYQGLDFGFNDPSAFVKVGYIDDELYVYDELYLRGLTNNELIPHVKAKAGPGTIIADSSEPDRIKEFRQQGMNVQGAVKEQGSVKAGLDWAKRRRIHISPECQNFIHEIQSYKYREDRDGNVLDEPVDFNNHLLDAFRYSLEPLRKERRLTVGKNIY